MGAGFFYCQRFRRFSRFFSCFMPTIDSLTPQSQPAHYFVVLLDVYLLQVIEQTSSVRDHFQQAAPRVIVFLVRLEMLGEFVNPLT